MALHFSNKEYSERKTKVLNSMRDQNLDAILMFKQESMYWLTGYDTFGYVFFQTLILDKNGNLILLTRAPDLRQAQNTSIINDIRIWVDKDQSNPTEDQLLIRGYQVHQYVYSHMDVLEYPHNKQLFYL